MRSWGRGAFGLTAAGLWLSVLATAITHARLAPGPGESAALADAWRVLGGASPVAHGPPWAWGLAFLAQHGAGFSGLIFGRWLLLGTVTLAAAGAIAWIGVESWKKRSVVFATLAFTALLSAADAAPWMLAALAIVVTSSDRPQAPRYAAGLWLGATLLWPRLLVPAVVAIEVLAVLRAPARGAMRSARESLVSLGVLAAAWGLVALSTPDALAMCGDLTGRLADPGARAVVPAAGLGLAGVFALIGIGAARSGDRDALSFGAAIPLFTLGLLRGDPDAVHLGALPALAALILIGVRNYPRRFALFTTSGLAVVLALAGFMPRFDARTAWSVGQLDGLGAAPREEPATRPSDQCEHVPYDLVAQTGGTPFPEPASAASCPTALFALAGPRGGPTRAAAAFAHDRVRVWSERYEPMGLPGFDVVRGRLRDPPRYVEEQTLPLETGEHGVGVEEVHSIPLGRLVSAEHVVVLSARLSAGRIDGAIGRAPRLRARFYRGERPVGRPYLVPLRQALDRRADLWLPVDPERAEWRWVAGWHDDAAPAADRVELSLADGPIEHVMLTTYELRETSPPPAPAREAECVARRALDEPPDDLLRPSRPVFDGEVIALRPGDEEVALRFDPCPGACLLGEAAFAPDLVHDGATLRAEVRAGPRLVDRFTRALGREYRRPFEVPVDGVSGVRFVADGPVDIFGLRVEPCVSQVSVIHGLHSGRHEVVRGDVTLSGDTLRMPIAAMGTPAAEVRIPVHLPERACFAMDLSVTALDSHVAVVVGLFGPGDTLYRVDRQVLTPEDHAMRRLSEIDLSPWPDRDATLYLGAWALGATEGDTVVEIMRPRIHRCGEPAFWAF